MIHTFELPRNPIFFFPLLFLADGTIFTPAPRNIVKFAPDAGFGAGSSATAKSVGLLRSSSTSCTLSSFFSINSLMPIIAVLGVGWDAEVRLGEGEARADFARR